MRPSLNYALLLIILLTITLLTFSSSYAADSKPVANKSSQKKGEITITTDKLIKIEIKDATLYEALKAISKKSKIDFDVTENLLKEKISIKTTSPDWTDALKKVLKKYNYANSWKKNKLVKVFIFEHGSDSPVQLIPPGDQTAVAGLEPLPPDISEMEETGQNMGAILAGPEEGMIGQDLLDIPLPGEEALKMIEITEDVDTPLFPEALDPELKNTDKMDNKNSGEEQDKKQIDSIHTGTDNVPLVEIPGSVSKQVEQDPN